MSRSSIQVANWFIERSEKQLTIMQLLKLAYITHGFKMACHNDETKTLFGDDVEAWKYGPVIREIYDGFKGQGRGTIKIIVALSSDCESDFDASELKMLDAIYKRYGGMPGFSLSALTHAKGTPWHKVWHEIDGGNGFETVIPNKMIKDHFQSILYSDAKE